MPLPLTVSCFSKIQIGFTLLVPAHPGSPGQRAVKQVCVFVCYSCGTSVCAQSGRKYCSELGLWQVECKHAEPKDGTSSSSQLLGGDVAAAAAGGPMILAQAADGSVGLVPASALHASAAALRQATMGPAVAAAAGGVGLMSSADLSAAAAANYRAHELLQPSLLSAGLYFSPGETFVFIAATIIVFGWHGSTVVGRRTYSQEVARSIPGLVRLRNDSGHCGQVICTHVPLLPISMVRS